ncbi:hypothetical protein PAXINDRAFT_170120 [Paxillus involutus ATCC 200175]|uniref:Autophagy-related protein 27 n=1 Tax=Paxillus involutus ATCC 200175 TaxID=664439 RepID=A0A0C9TU79_PAXIN|nr:hypothetical protein PAXINDRAFT_170120 [Paxillus involutus ATCC 200175]
MVSCSLRSSLLLLLSTSAFAADKPCTLHDGDKYYDLSALKASKDYQFQTDGGHTFYLNVCRGVTTDPWNTGVDEKEGNIAGLVRRDHGDFAIGLVNTTLEAKEGGLMLRQSNGSPCTGLDSGLRGSSTIRFICDTSVYAAGKPVLLVQWPSDEDKACSYELEWRTHYACPTGEGGLFGGLIVFCMVTATILLMAFVVISTLYNRFVLRLSGYDQMPKFTFSHVHEIWDVCSDFLHSVLDLLIAQSRSWRSRGYGNVNSTSHHWTSREEEEAMIVSDPLEMEAESVHDATGGVSQGAHPHDGSGPPSEEGGDNGTVRL